MFYAEEGAEYGEIGQVSTIDRILKQRKGIRITIVVAIDGDSVEAAPPAVQGFFKTFANHGRELELHMVDKHGRELTR